MAMQQAIKSSVNDSFFHLLEEAITFAIYTEKSHSRSCDVIVNRATCYGLLITIITSNQIKIKQALSYLGYRKAMQSNFHK